MCYGDQPNPALLAEAINRIILAAVEIEDEKAFRREPQTPNGRPRFLHTRGGALWRTRGWITLEGLATLT
ncbi:hypothetical protein IMZ48_42255 [Candidatus Bathyarchaeota archaeon]|nr:hypothetical protein [Candidatus Bathyarchaeota archaeon]